MVYFCVVDVDCINGDDDDKVCVLIERVSLTKSFVMQVFFIIPT